MNTLVFGISGLPHGDGKTKFVYTTAIPHLRGLGLDAMELPVFDPRQFRLPDLTRLPRPPHPRDVLQRLRERLPRH